MPFYTGTVANIGQLKATIESLCVSNGWTLSAQDYLYKGQSFVKLTTEAPYGFTLDGATYDALRIIGANSSDGSVKPAPRIRYLYVPATAYPITYYISIQANPDMVVCVVRVGVSAYRVLMFGDIVKVHVDAFVGGNFFWASHIVKTTTHDRTFNREFLNAIDNTDFVAAGVLTGGTMTTVIPFSNWNGVNSHLRNYAEGFHAEIGNNFASGNHWGTWATNTLPQTVFTDATRQALFRTPNTWTSQAVLVPMNLQQHMADSLWAYIGYVEHMRLVRIDNYNPTDILTIGSENWIVFPWLEKNIVERNGTGFTGSLTLSPFTGTVGFALRYDP